MPAVLKRPAAHISTVRKRPASCTTAVVHDDLALPRHCQEKAVVSVVFPSGQKVIEDTTVSLEEDGSEFQRMVQSSARKRLRFITAEGTHLERGLSLKKQGILDGAVLTAIVKPPMKIFSTQCSFTAVTAGSEVIDWGELIKGGCESVRDQLRAGIEEICVTDTAYAALTSAGSVVTWGSPSHGGDSSKVKFRLASNIRKLFGSRHGRFAALTHEGAVVHWGRSRPETDEFEKLIASDVQNIHFAWDGSLMATKLDGSVHCGAPYFRTEDYGIEGTDCSELGVDIKSVCSTSFATAALKNSGAVVTCGAHGCVDDPAETVAIDTVRDALSNNIEQVFATDSAFAAVQTDGALITWGNRARGGDISFTDAPSKNSELQRNESDSGKSVVTIASTFGAFAALLHDGSVLTWGEGGQGGHSCKVSQALTDVKSITATRGAFAALSKSGAVTAWGSPEWGGDISKVKKQLSASVQAVFATHYAFAALKSDGSVVTWGNQVRGGDSSKVRKLLDAEAI